MVVNTPSIGSNHSTSSRGNKKKSFSSSPVAASATNNILPLSAAESQDVDDNMNKPSNNSSSSMSIFQQLLFNMNPVQCLSPSIARCSNPLADDDDDDNDNKNRPNFDKEVPPLLKDLEHEGKLRTTALQKLYRMTDKDNQKNRVPVVCSESFDTLRALLPCLSPTCASHDRRQALLLLNNLCIPMENKRHILCDGTTTTTRDEILPALLRIFKKRLAESFLSAACLFNLSFYEEGKHMLLNYIPNAPSGVVLCDDDDDDEEVQSGYKCHKAPSDNEKSLLRVVEALLMDFTPYLQKQLEHELKQQEQQQQKASSSSSSPPSSTSPRQQQHTKPISTVEAATTRWCIAMLRNLATVPENAQIIATTTAIPLLTAHCLLMSTHALPQRGNSGSGSGAGADASNDLSHWARDSLEDSSLMLLLWLSQGGSQGLGASASGDNGNNNNKPIDLDESIGTNKNGNGNHSVTSVEQQSALEALDLPVIRQALQGIQNKPGIHGVRAKVILQRMNEAVNQNQHQHRAATPEQTNRGRVTPPPEDDHDNVRVIVTTTNSNSTSNSSSSNSKPTTRNHHHQRQRSDDVGDASQVGFDTDVVQEIIKTVESHRLLNDDNESYDDNDDRLRVDNITLASF